LFDRRTISGQGTKVVRPANYFPARTGGGATRLIASSAPARFWSECADVDPLRRLCRDLHDADVRVRVARPTFILAFAVGCVLSSAYGFLSGAWPFGVVELIWSGIAVRRWLQVRAPGRTP
jgi:hypothetical protein